MGAGRWNKARILLCVLACSTVLVTQNAFAASSSWTWLATGSVGQVMHCLSPSSSAVATKDVCEFHVTEPPSSTALVTETLVLKNTSAKRVCVGLSIATSYMGGVQQFCVSPNASTTHREHGPGSHYRQTLVSIFITSGSRSRPIAPIVSGSTCSFSLTFAQ